MSKKAKTRSQADADSRRDFVKKAGKAAVAAPATAVLLSASTVPSQVRAEPYKPGGTGAPGAPGT